MHRMKMKAGLLAAILLCVVLTMVGCGKATSGNATITVNDGKDPIAGASVTLDDRTGLTDDQGQITFTDVPVGKHAVAVTKVGFAAGTGEVVVESKKTASATITLTRLTGNVTVTVNDGENPIENAAVHAGGQTEYTDPSGQASFTLVPGDYAVTAGKEGYEDGSTDLTVNEGQTTTAEISLTRQTGSATITVNDGTSALADATVTLDGVSKTTNASGQVTFTGVPTGSYTASASLNGYSSNTGNVTIQSGETATATISLTRQTGSATITVKEGSVALAGATVTLYGAPKTTNASGQVTFTGVPTGSYTVSASLNGYSSNSVGITIQNNTTATATISLIRETGNVTVWVFDHSNYGSVGNVSMSGVSVKLNGKTSVTALSGNADFTNVPTGTYTATVNHSGFAPGSVNVTVTKNRALDTSFTAGSYAILLVKPTAGQVTITLLRGDGSPLVGARVTLNDTNPARAVVSGSDGKASFDGVPNGTWTVNVTPADYMFPMTFAIDVDESHTTFTYQCQWW